MNGGNDNNMETNKKEKVKKDKKTEYIGFRMNINIYKSFEEKLKSKKMTRRDFFERCAMQFIFQDE